MQGAPAAVPTTTTTSQLTVRVLFFGPIQETVSAPEERVTLAAGATVGDLLCALAARHGEAFSEALLAPTGEPLPNAVVQLDGKNILHLQGRRTPLIRDGTLHIVVTPGFIGGG
jgi:molybdopterin converting factor small subunit